MNKEHLIERLYQNDIIRFGDFKLKSMPFSLNNISTAGNINNGANANFQTTVITFSDFNAKIISKIVKDYNRFNLSN